MTAVARTKEYLSEDPVQQHPSTTSEQLQMDAFAWYLDCIHRLAIEDIEPTETPGIWRIRQPCKGVGYCSSPLHSFLFCEGPVRHTIRHLDSGRDSRGRFASPYLTWREHRRRLCGESGILSVLPADNAGSL